MADSEYNAEEAAGTHTLPSTLYERRRYYIADTGMRFEVVRRIGHFEFNFEHTADIFAQSSRRRERSASFPTVESTSTSMLYPIERRENCQRGNYLLTTPG